MPMPMPMPDPDDAGSPSSSPDERRPALTTDMTGDELQRWYYLRTELASLARALGVSPAGGKTGLTNRLVHTLSGRPVPPSNRRTVAKADGQLHGTLTINSIIPVGQRCSQTLRAFFTDHIGIRFHFDGHMRSFIGSHGGATLGDAIAHWYATRGAAPAPIGEQFELNRFTQEYHRQHPGSTRQDLLAAWTLHRATPTDERGPVF